jgi:hypothetical protein
VDLFTPARWSTCKFGKLGVFSGERVIDEIVREQRTMSGENV